MRSPVRLQSRIIPVVGILERALALAANAHAGQEDKAGQPYILHPIRVMLNVRTDEERTVALLHDVVEDTPIGFDDDKLAWVKAHLGSACRKRLILSHSKQLNRGDFLVDDRPNNGARDFEGELIVSGSARFPDWRTVLPYLRERA